MRFSYFLLMIIGISGCDLLERPEMSYVNMTEAIEHGAIDRGWVPEWIPAQATNIREIHDIDTNESMMAFDLPNTVDWRLPNGCKLISYSELRQPRFSRNWWPSNSELKRSYIFHQCPGDDPWTKNFVWVARHKTGGKALHWRAHAL